jgi:nicotinamidase-related amidase
MADHGFQVIVVEDACTELSDESHRAALLTFGLIFGRVRRSEQILELFGAAEAKAEPDSADVT